MPRPATSRALLVAEGSRLMRRVGFTDAGLGELLATAGLPKGKLYNYFPSKEAFGVEVAEAFYGWHDRALAELAEGEGSPLARLGAYFELLLDATRRSPSEQWGCLLAVLALEKSTTSEALRGAVARSFARWQERVAGRPPGAGRGRARRRGGRRPARGPRAPRLGRGAPAGPPRAGAVAARGLARDRPPATARDGPVRSGRLHYGWIVVAVVLLALVMSAGFRSTTGLLIDPLQEEFGWSKGAISLAVSVNLVLFGLVAPFAAALMERFGVRRVMLAALAVVAGASALTTVIDSPWQLDLLWGVAMGCATGAISVPLAAIVATRWFARRRGLVTGVLTASTATGQLVFLPLLAVLVAAWGWRSASWTVAIVAVAIVVPAVALFMRDRPEDVGLRAYGADGGRAAGATA